MVFDYQMNSSPQLSETGEQNYPKDIHHMENTDLLSLMTNYLPSMHNPWTEMTHVVGNNSTQKVSSKSQKWQTMRFCPLLDQTSS